MWEGKGPVRSKAKVVNELEPNGSGTRFSYRNEYSLPGGPLGNMAGPMVRRVTGKEWTPRCKNSKRSWSNCLHVTEP